MNNLTKRTKGFYLTDKDIVSLNICEYIEFFHNTQKNSGLMCMWKNNIKYNMYVASRVQLLDKDKCNGCSFTLNHCQLSFNWQTISNFFKIKDELELVWTSDKFTTEECADHGIHVDALELLVFRQNSLAASFLIDCYPAHDSNNRIIEGTNNHFDLSVLRK